MGLSIKITKPGYDVTKETDPRNFALNSEFNHLKSVKSGSFQVTLNAAASDTTAVSHGLSYKPMAIAYFRETSDSSWYIASTDPEKAVTRPVANGNVSVYTDGSNAYFEVQNRTAAQRTFEVKYEMFYEGDS